MDKKNAGKEFMRVKGLTLRFLLNATNGKLSGNHRVITGVSIDSRTIKRGEVFFALRGENYDGTVFVKDALRKGAAYTVVDRNTAVSEGVIKVGDTLFALGELARRWRERFSVKCIGITGTGGKTTTRKIINHLLTGSFKCSQSMRNYNNMIGLPLSTLTINGKTEIAILEMAMNHRGEIRRLSHISHPEVGVITNVGRGHLEFLGSIKNVAEAKSELLASLKIGNVAILNADDRYIMKMRRKTGLEVITFGIENPSDFTAGNIKVGKTDSKFSVNGIDNFELKLPGRFNIYNALAGIATASLFGIGSDTLKKRLRTLRAEPLRLNRILAGGVILYNDSYNANPDSMGAAISAVAKEEGKRRIACLADMLELGKRTKEFHGAVGRKLLRNHFDVVFLYGPLSIHIARALRAESFKGLITHFSLRSELTDELLRTVRKGDVILIKGSRRNRLDITAKTLIKHLRGRK